MPSTRSSHTARALHLTQAADLNKSRGYADAVYADYRVTGNHRRFHDLPAAVSEALHQGLISDRAWGHVSWGITVAPE